MEAVAEPTLSSLLGSWRLVSEIVTFSDTGECVAPHGGNPAGWMVLSTSGRIMFLFGKADREPPVSEADQVGLFATMVAYTGKVRLDGAGRFLTTIDLAFNPALRGEQVRFFGLDGNRLTIRTPKQTIPIFGDRPLVVELVWQRES